MKARIAGISLRAIAFGLLIPVAAACGGGRSDAPPYEDPHPLPEEPLVIQAPEIGAYGGRFVIGQTNSPRTFNHMMASESSSTDVTQLLFVGLTRFDNGTQQGTPGLAKSYEVSEDRLTWTFHLRRGARFSDGHPITAADVLFSFELAYDETLHPSVQDLLIMNGRKWEVTAPDDYTVVIKTPAPNAMVESLAGAVYVLPKHVLEPAFRSGTFASAYSVSTPPDQIVTSGPFRVRQYVANERTVLGRNPYWFGVDAEQQRLPYLDEVVFNVVPDQDAADLQFRAGQLDGLDNVKAENYTWYEENQQAGNFTLHDLGPELNSAFFWFNLNKVREPAPGKRVGQPQVDATKYGWFSNVAFRRAVSMAVDRDAMITSIFFSDAVKNWSTASPGDKLWYSPEIVKYDYNPDEARRLLAGLKWSDRNGDGFLEDTAGNTISFTLKTNSDNRMRVSMANFIRDDLAKVGIRVVLAPVDFNTLITNLREDFQYEAILLGLQSGVPPDPGMGQNVWRSSGRSHNWNSQQSKPETPQEARIDALVDLIISTSDYNARKAAWVEIQNLVNEQAWLIWLPTLRAKLPLSNRFGNTQPSVIRHRLLWNIERVFVRSRAAQN
jgi:peptide/nickel transport system substrate-binding protein